MSSDLRIRGNDYAGRSHNEPGARLASNIIHLAGRFSPPPSTLGCTVPRQGNDRARTSLSSIWNAACEAVKSFTFFLICLFGGLVITGAALVFFFVLPFIH